MRALFVDSFAALVFFTVVAGLVELLFAGMSPDQVLAARLVAIPVILATGRPYGMWRDMVFRRFGRNISPLLVDIGAFLSFQVPVYAGILAIAGASIGQMTAAIGAALVFMPLIGRPYGLFLSICRRLTGVTAAH